MKAKTRKEIIKWKMIHYDTDILFDYDWEPDHFRDKEKALDYRERVSDPIYKYHKSDYDSNTDHCRLTFFDSEGRKYRNIKYEEAYYLSRGKYIRSSKNWLVDFPTKEHVINLLRTAYARPYWTKWVNEEVAPILDKTYDALSVEERRSLRDERWPEDGSLGDFISKLREWCATWAIQDKEGRLKEEEKIRQRVSNWRVQIGSFPEYKELDMEQVKRDFYNGHLEMSPVQIKALDDPEFSKMAINVNARKRLAHWMCRYWYKEVQPRLIDYEYTIPLSDDFDDSREVFANEITSLIMWTWFDWAAADKKSKENIERELVEKLSHNSAAKYLDLSKPQLFMPTERQIAESNIWVHTSEGCSYKYYTEEEKKQLIQNLKEVRE